MYYSADVCNAEEMKQAVQAGKAHFGHIDGVIHAAGIEGGGSILEKEIGEYLKTLEPKVQGTLALEEALQESTLISSVIFHQVRRS
nr:SDR family oxidoreductase [Bacillus velezensis]